jgi:hypothetical protein
MPKYIAGIFHGIILTAAILLSIMFYKENSQLIAIPIILGIASLLLWAVLMIDIIVKDNKR